MSEEKNYKTICEQIRDIKFKYWTPPEDAKKQEVKEVEKVSVNFYKGDIKSTFIRNDRKVACIAFPKNSLYSGYVWFYPVTWIKTNKDNAEKRWLTINKKYKITIVKSEKDASGKFVKIDEKAISADELKEAMKRTKK